MLRTPFRIGMILLVAALVCGALYLYVSASGSTLGGLRGDGERPAFNQSASPTGAQRAEFGGRDRGEGGASGFGGLLGQALKVALVTLVVVGIQKLARRLRGRPRPPTVQPQAA